MGATTSKLVHIVDDDADAVATASSALIRAGYAVQVWEDASAFLAATRLRTDECVLLDIASSGGDAVEAQRQLRTRDANMAVVMTGAGPEIGVVIRTMKEGAVDFLLKPFDQAALLGAMGEAFRRIARHQARSQPASIAERKLRLLSTRERQVLRGLTDGLSNKEIAIELNISPRTVEIHRANLMAKLEARSLSGALQIAFAAGIARPAAHPELLAS